MGLEIFDHVHFASDLRVSGATLNPDVRRAVAFVVARLSAQSDFDSITDEAGVLGSFRGSVTSTGVDIHDYTRGCNITGTMSDGKLSLYDYGVGANIEITIEGSDKFSGFDYSTSGQFEGSVTPGTVELYDLQAAEWFSYTF